MKNDLLILGGIVATVLLLKNAASVNGVVLKRKNFVKKDQPKTVNYRDYLYVK